MRYAVIYFCQSVRSDSEWKTLNRTPYKFTDSLAGQFTEQISQIQVHTCILYMYNAVERYL